MTELELQKAVATVVAEMETVVESEGMIGMDGEAVNFLSALCIYSEGWTMRQAVRIAYGIETIFEAGSGAVS